MSEITRRPPRVSIAVALAAATVAVGIVAAVDSVALGLAALGLPAFAYGLFRGSRRGVNAGTAAVLAGVLYAGWVGAGPELLVLGSLAGLFAWDVGGNAVDVGEQLGREASTRRVELVHAAASLAVGSFTVAVGYGVFLAASGGQPVTALVFLLAGAVALVSGFR